MNKTKPNWVRIGIVLAGLAILAIVVGWGVHFVLDALSKDTAPATLTPLTTATPVPVTGPTQTPFATSLATVSPDSMPTSQPTSTPRPTSTITPTPDRPQTETVRYGEGVYAVCRRHCAGCWGDKETPPNLVAYAKAVAAANNRSWNNSNVFIYAGMELIMPPCPSECP